MGDGRGVLTLTWWHDAEGKQQHRIGVADCGRFVGLAERLGVDHELEVFAAARHPDRLGVARDGIMCLWVRVETKESARLLEVFRPAPTIVLQEGDSSRRVALWAVTKPHTVDQALRANRRLAHALKAPKKHASPDEFSFAPPGTFLRHGRRRPCPVTVVGHECRIYGPTEVYGRLKDAPDPDAWRQRAA